MPKFYLTFWVACFSVTYLYILCQTTKQLLRAIKANCSKFIAKSANSSLQAASGRATVANRFVVHILQTGMEQTDSIGEDGIVRSSSAAASAAVASSRWSTASRGHQLVAECPVYALIHDALRAISDVTEEPEIFLDDYVERLIS